MGHLLTAQTAMFLVGYFVLFWGLSKRFGRMENRANQLELTECKRNHAKEWGFPEEEIESWSRKSAQDDKWSFCLTAGTLCPTNQERQ